MDYEKAEKNFYEKLWQEAGNWERKITKYADKVPGIEGKSALNFLKKKLAVNAKILDIGCGGGRNSVLFAKNGFEAHGVDVSSSAVKLAEKLAIEEMVKADFRAGSVFGLDYGRNYFDAFADFGCFHHLRKMQWKKYLDNVLKVLKKDGYFVLYTFSTESGKTRNYNPSSKRNWSVRMNHYYHYFSMDEIRKIFSKYFRILESKTIREKGRILAFNLVFMQKL